MARKLWPEILPPTEQEVACDIAFREAVHAVVPSRRRRRESARKLPAKEIEIPFDF